eukprot:196400-Heterocapsa_arctica.AAC.1
MYRGWNNATWGPALPLVLPPPECPKAPSAWLGPFRPPPPEMCRTHRWVNNDCDESRPFRDWHNKFGHP